MTRVHPGRETVFSAICTPGDASKLPLEHVYAGRHFNVAAKPSFWHDMICIQRDGPGLRAVIILIQEYIYWLTNNDVLPYYVFINVRERTPKEAA